MMVDLYNSDGLSFPRLVCSKAARTGKTRFHNLLPTGNHRSRDDSAILRRARPRIRPDCADYLFGGFLGLAVATELSPLRILPLTAHAVWLLPFVTFQDLALLAALAWLFHGLLSVVKQSTARRALAALGWILCLLLALYPYLSVVIFAIIRRP